MHKHTQQALLLLMSVSMSQHEDPGHQGCGNDHMVDITVLAVLLHTDVTALTTAFHAFHAPNPACRPCCSTASDFQAQQHQELYALYLWFSARGLQKVQTEDPTQSSQPVVSQLLAFLGAVLPGYTATGGL
jgi:hypothetical protein